MSKVGDSPVHFRLSTGGLAVLIQRWIRGQESSEIPIPVQMLIAFGLLWVPLVVFSLFEGSFTGTSVAHPLVSDIVPHVRFLIAVPMLLFADLVIDPVTNLSVRNIKSSGIVPDTGKPGLRTALNNLQRARDSIWPDIVIIVLAFFVTWLFKPGYGGSTGVTDTTSWMLNMEDGGVRYSVAGWWYFLISGPMFQVILFRWIWRFLIWAVFLFRVSRLQLVLRPTHPDLAGGLGYLGMAQQAFMAVFVAFTTVASSTFAHDILSGREKLSGVLPEIVALVLIFVVIIYVPLLFFSKQLLAVRRLGLEEYGLLSDRLSEAFHQKWVGESDEAAGKDILRSADPSAVADYTAVYDNVRSMRLVPATLRNVLTVAGILVVPFLPLALTEFSLHDLVQRLAGSLV